MTAYAPSESSSYGRWLLAPSVMYITNRILRAQVILDLERYLRITSVAVHYLYCLDFGEYFSRWQPLLRCFSCQFHNASSASKHISSSATHSSSCGSNIR